MNLKKVIVSFMVLLALSVFGMVQSKAVAIGTIPLCEEVVGTQLIDPAELIILEEPVNQVEKLATVSCCEMHIRANRITPAVCMAEDMSNMDGMAKSVQGMGVVGSLYEALVISVLISMYIVFVRFCGSDNSIKFN
jgi:hypothetical protein